MDILSIECIFKIIKYVFKLCNTKEELDYNINNIKCTNKLYFIIVNEIIQKPKYKIDISLKDINKNINNIDCSYNHMQYFDPINIVYERINIYFNEYDSSKDISYVRFPLDIYKKEKQFFFIKNLTNINHEYSYLIIVYEIPISIKEERLYFNPKGFNVKDIIELILNFYSEKLDETYKRKIIYLTQGHHFWLFTGYKFIMSNKIDIKSYIKNYSTKGLYLEYENKFTILITYIHKRVFVTIINKKVK